MSAEKAAWLRLIATETVGAATFFQLLAFAGSAVAAIELAPQLAGRGGAKKPLRVPSAAWASKLLKTCEQAGIGIICSYEAGYPPALLEIDNPPPVLFYQGNLGLLHRSAVAIVGARNASANGRAFARKLAQELGTAGITVVSGLARGVDTAAHQGSLASGTVGVVAGGVDYVYPPENATLFDALRSDGLIIAENFPGMVPQARHFPRRNRIIAGVAQATAVIEAAPRSGSLITARLAAEQGREVFAVPGSPLDPRCGGTNQLLKDGAQFLEAASDILDYLHNRISHTTLREAAPTTPVASGYLPEQDAERCRAVVLELLGQAPVLIDSLIAEAGATAAAVHLVILELELAGKLERHAGDKVSRIF